MPSAKCIRSRVYTFSRALTISSAFYSVKSGRIISADFGENPAERYDGGEARKKVSRAGGWHNNIVPRCNPQRQNFVLITWELRTFGAKLSSTTALQPTILDGEFNRRRRACSAIER